MRKLLLLLMLLAIPAQAADNIAVTVGTGTTIGTKDLAGVHLPKHTPVDQAGAEVLGLVTASPGATTVLGRLKTIADALAGSLSTAASIADGASVAMGARADARNTATDTTAVTLISVAKQISFSGQAAAASLAGTLTVGLPSGASTAANQATANTALGAPGDTVCATDTGSCSIEALLKKIAQNLSGAIPAGTNLIGETRPAIGAARLSSVSLSFASSGDNTAITRSVGTIKVYRVMLVCASDVLVKFKNGTGTDLTGAMTMRSAYLPFEMGEPHFVTTSTNNFVINLGSAVQCSGRAFYIDS